MCAFKLSPILVDDHAVGGKLGLRGIDHLERLQNAEQAYTEASQVPGNDMTIIWRKKRTRGVQEDGDQECATKRVEHVHRPYPRPSPVLLPPVITGHEENECCDGRRDCKLLSHSQRTASDHHHHHGDVIAEHEPHIEGHFFPVFWVANVSHLWPSLQPEAELRRLTRALYVIAILVRRWTH